MYVGPIRIACFPTGNTVHSPVGFGNGVFIELHVLRKGQ